MINDTDVANTSCVFFFLLIFFYPCYPVFVVSLVFGGQRYSQNRWTGHTKSSKV